MSEDGCQTFISRNILGEYCGRRFKLYAGIGEFTTMYLKSLEINGFKSFAKSTTLTFTKRISAVVGPNGCGKSNVVDAIRWALGEQSLKMLRTKKSEDLIFSGSDKSAKKSLASVMLTFDNSDRAFNIDFNDVVIGRKLYRDGETEYVINGAPVRLKDIALLVASAKLGLRGYTIVSQGMADAMLSATPRERREIFDDALGLKEFQIKKYDSERKLKETEENLGRAKDLLREITPHLRFLKKQAEKIMERSTLEKTLQELEKKYVQHARHDLRARRMKLEKEYADVAHALDELRKSLDAKEQARGVLEEKFGEVVPSVTNFEKALEQLEEEKNKLERELGRIEGMMESQKAGGAVPSRVRVPDLASLKDRIHEMHSLVRRLVTYTSIQEIKVELRNVESILEEAMDEFEVAKTPAAPEKEIAPNEGLKAQKITLLHAMQEIEKKVREIKISIREEGEKARKEQVGLLELKDAIQGLTYQIREKEDRRVILSGEQGRIMEEERMLKEEYKHIERHEDLGGIVEEGVALHELRKEIEKVKIRLEFVGNIDPEIEKEYNETLERHTFLTRESEDLVKAIDSLRSLIKDLEKEIENRFETSFNGISEGFDRFVKTLFNGGKARLVLVKPRELSLEEQEVGMEAKDQETGIEMKVDLPGKRVSSISSLSGGEKALVSVALLFALISTSPPPFLVLDEVDAALDEANSLRLRKILDELSPKTQFIVVTHNREIMTGAEVLYGVTMGEDNASKVLSLSFEQSKTFIA